MSAGECNSAHNVIGYLEISIIRVKGITFDIIMWNEHNDISTKKVDKGCTVRLEILHDGRMDVFHEDPGFRGPFLNCCLGDMEVRAKAVLPIRLLCPFVTNAYSGPNTKRNDFRIM